MNSYKDFLDAIVDVATKVDEFLWGDWTKILIASVALYLTVRTGFFQVTKFGYILKNTFGRIFIKSADSDKQSITPFQAATTSLASTVGMGNIAGVGTALSVGGPGAIFWMWLLAFVGMMLKTAEITIAVHYREVDEKGVIRGGPMYYIEKGLGLRPLAWMFSFGVFLASITGATLLQPHTVGRAFLASYSVNPYVVTGLMAIATGIVVIGGIKRIGQVCEKLVPSMALIYIAAALIIFVINFSMIPEVFGTIFKYAFAPVPAAGGFMGATVAAAIKNGMARGMLSNEAGMGTAPIVHATAETEHPFQQGIWGAFEVFIDTIVICTITAFAILSTGAMTTGQSGIELVITAFGSIFPTGVAQALITFSIATFCLSTQIGYFYYYETSIINMFGKKAMYFFKWFYLIPGVAFAGFANVDDLWVFANIFTASCGIPNVIAVLILSGVFFKLLKDYMLGKMEYTTDIVDKSRKYIKMAKSYNPER